MISTNTVRAKTNDGPQRLTTLTTNKVKPKTEADVLAAATATRDVLRGRVRHFETKKYSGPMLTVSNMADRVVNEKRKALMAKRKEKKILSIQFSSGPIKNIGVVRIQEARPEKRRGRPKKS